MDDIDDILNDLGVSPTSTPVSSSQENTDSSSAFSDEDISDILQENGFSNISEELSTENEGHEEEVENTEYLSRQAEEAAFNGIEELHTAVSEYLEEHSTPIENPIEENLAEETPQEQSETVETDEAEVPLNSPTLILDDTTSRFSGAEWYSEIQKQRIIVAGCGGIGSNLLFQLARMVPANLTIYDDDTVERANMAGQLFSYADIGKHKVDAMANTIVLYTAMHQINALSSRFTAYTEAGDIMMCGFDNMAARKTFFEAWCRHLDEIPEDRRSKCLYLDGRLSIDTLQIFCIRGDDNYNKNRYKKEFLFSDYEADETVCSMKQTTYLACMIGSLMVNLFTNFVANTIDPVIPYDMPFFTEYDAQNMIFKTEN